MTHRLSADDGGGVFAIVWHSVAMRLHAMVLGAHCAVLGLPWGVSLVTHPSFLFYLPLSSPSSSLLRYPRRYVESIIQSMSDIMRGGHRDVRCVGGSERVGQCGRVAPPMCVHLDMGCAFQVVDDRFGACMGCPPGCWWGQAPVLVLLTSSGCDCCIAAVEMEMTTTMSRHRSTVSCHFPVGVHR